LTPYQYGNNNPIGFNDPTGATAESMETGRPLRLRHLEGSGYYRIAPGSGNHWSDRYRSVEGNAAMMGTATFRDFYGLGNGHGGTDYGKAAELARSLGTTYTNEGYYSYGSSDGGKNWTNNGWTDVWAEIAQSGGMTDFSNSNWALNIGGATYGAMEG